MNNLLIALLLCLLVGLAIGFVVGYVLGRDIGSKPVRNDITLSTAEAIDMPKAKCLDEWREDLDDPEG